MAKPRARFVCLACGAVSTKWQGRCDSCGEWNTLEEDTSGRAAPANLPSASAEGIELVTLAGETVPLTRTFTGLTEFDRVTGGGFVPGSAILVGGDPGIGKSTLLIQAAAALANAGKRVVYISGEEAIDQVRIRADRLGLRDAEVELAAETRVEDILATLKVGDRPDLIVIDSIQTIWTERAESAPGTVTQVRTSAQALIRAAKTSGAALVLVGHVTKEGQIAGPRVVEHMVDAVLYFEGDAGHQYRLLRAVKNRFGATPEIGVFEMTGRGLKDVLSPSELFVGDRRSDSPGAAVLAGMEGTRPILVEVQALVAPTSLGTPRRAAVGADQSRLAMILAVLEARCGVRFGQHDVYLNVAGGMKLSEPAADIAVAAALISSRSGVATPAESVYFGEISLSGAIRPVAHTAARLKEAEKLGFAHAVLPEAAVEDERPGLSFTPIGTLSDLVARIAGSQPTLGDDEK